MHTETLIYKATNTNNINPKCNRSTHPPVIKLTFGAVLIEIVFNFHWFCLTSFARKKIYHPRENWFLSLMSHRIKSTAPKSQTLSTLNHYPAKYGNEI